LEELVANKVRGERVLRGDEDYTIVFNSNAIAQAESELGYGIGVAMQHFMGGAFSINETRILLWAALLKYHGPLSVNDAGEILDEVLAKGKDFLGTFTVLMDAVNDAIPFKEEGEDPNARVRALETGTRARQKSSGKASSKPASEQD
jgi:hypothetical protein